MLDSSYMAHYGFRIEAVWEGEPVVFVKREGNGEIWIVTDTDGVGLPSEGGPVMLAHYANEEALRNGDDTVWGLRNCGDVVAAIRDIKLTPDAPCSHAWTFTYDSGPDRHCDDCGAAHPDNHR
jgi:hypothetical protein